MVPSPNQSTRVPAVLMRLLRLVAPPAPQPLDPRFVLSDDHAAAVADAVALAREAELFAPRPPRELVDSEVPSVATHLNVLAGIAWLFTIEPVFSALTPPNFYGIPAPQLLAVLFVAPVIWLALQWIWFSLGPNIRTFARARLLEWKLWLVLAVALQVWGRAG